MARQCACPFRAVCGPVCCFCAWRGRHAGECRKPYGNTGLRGAVARFVIHKVIMKEVPTVSMFMYSPLCLLCEGNRL